MKKYLLVFVLLLLAVPVQAEDSTVAEQCEAFGNLAYLAMTNRQAGVAMSRQMKVVGDHYIMQQIVINAYEEPRRIDEGAKQIVSEEYRDVWYSSCLVVHTER